MTITLDIPEELAAQLGGSPQQLSREAFEAFVLETYRQNRIDAPQAAQVLGYSRMRWEQCLEEHGVLKDAYTVEDLERDVATLQRLRADGVILPSS